MSNNFESSPTVAEKLEIANKYWGIFIDSLKKTEGEPRIRSILSQLIIEHYINEILILKRQMKSYKDKLRFDQKLELLKQVEIPIESIALSKPEKTMFSPLFTEVEVDDYGYIYEIRNMYAHEIEFNKNLVEENLNRIKGIEIQLPIDLQEKYFKIVDVLMRKVQRAFIDLLVMEQEKFDGSPKPFKL